ncbi:MAG: primosomal protein N' [bacterium]
MYASIILPRPDMEPLIYRVPDGMKLSPGDMVRISLKNKMTWGVVREINLEIPSKLSDVKFKSVDSRILPTQLFKNKNQTDFLKWFSFYYIFPFPKLIKQIYGPFLSPRHKLPSKWKGKLPETASICREPEEMELSEEQSTVIESILSRWERKDIRPTLIFGITGSGKSEVYAKLARRILSENKKILYLVPEIGLTASALSHMESRIGEKGVLIHGTLPRTKRFYSFMKIQQGHVRFITGTRSSILYPLEDIGLIIVDEEHDMSYKSMEPPYYNARDCAVMKAKFLNIPVVLGSATPSSESFYNTINGKYHRENICSRINRKPLPSVSVFPYRGDTHIPSETAETIRNDLKNGHQTLFFLNRRGFATIATCKSCGYIEKCPHCETALIYHRKPAKLICHHCSFSKKRGSCPECGNEKISLEGAGIEKLYEAMRDLFPEAKLESVDRDSKKNNTRLEESLNTIRNGKIDVFSGTVMVSKGHNFPSLKNVIIKFSDYLLNFTDYRSAEKCFQTAIQVAGRAGRFSEEGKVWMEMLKPEHYLWEFLPNYDYEGFIKEELNWRKLLQLPPYSHLINLRITGSKKNTSKKTAEDIYKKLSEISSENKFKTFKIFPPMEPPLSRIGKKYRYIISIQIKPVKPMIKILGRLKREISLPSSVHLTFDIDSMNST